MLVISRKPNEAMVLDKKILVTVFEVLSSHVLLEIHAPRTTRIEWRSSVGRRAIKPCGNDHQFMLVMNPGASLRFNRQIDVSIREIKQEKARLGFVAPKHIPVERKEVYDHNPRASEQKGHRSDGL